MAKTIELRIPVNRVEGDLDIEVKIEDGIITEAKSIGTLYRGFENILKGRKPFDSLVITPRVCGICSVSHLLAAVKALENAYKITPPKQAVRLRNLSIISENMQSDLRQFFLMFMADFSNEYYQNKEFYDLASRLYAPFIGKTSKEVLDVTKNILKIVAYIGGQWPHTSHMVPGGLSVVADDLEILQIKYLILKIKEWYEKNVLNISIEEFEKITSLEEFENYVLKNPSSHVSIFTNIARETNLFNIGKCHYGFINYGSIDKEETTLIPKGIVEYNEIKEVNIEKITEDVTFAWYEGKNETPFKEKTKIDMQKNAYSFSKAPRYDDKPYQTGPLGEWLVSKNVFFWKLYERFGDSVFVRELARLLRPIKYLKIMTNEIEEIIQNIKEPLYNKPRIKTNAKGVGLTHAARGALGHWIKIKNGKIENYQIIAPTTWNGSPRDKNLNPGPWEKALTGLEIKDPSNPMEMGHVIRSFDPCLVCTVHFIGKDYSISLKA